MNAGELNQIMIAEKREIDDAIAELERRTAAAAKAEAVYRHAKSVAFLSTNGTVAEREARAENAINELRYQRDMAEGLKVSGLEALRSKRQKLSASQTMAALSKEEAAFARTGP
jgi:hypothetical protein